MRAAAWNTWRTLRSTALLCCVLICTACTSATVIEECTQRDAIEISALLQSYGIDATVSRESGGRGRYSVEVEKGARAQAQAILSKNGYPKGLDATLKDLLTPHGLIPNSQQVEAMRIDRAMAIDLEELLRAAPGVSLVRTVVHLNQQRHGMNASGAPKPTVSVVIQERKGAQVDPAKVAEIVERAVPGVSRDQMVILIGPEDSRLTLSENEGVANEGGKVIRKNLVPFLFFYRVAEDSYGKLALALVLCLVAVLAGGIIAGYWYGYYQSSRHLFEEQPEEAPLKSIKFDRPKKDLTGG